MSSDIYLVVLVILSMAILIFRGLRFFSWNRLALSFVLASCIIASMGYFYTERFAEVLRMASGVYLTALVMFVMSDFIVEHVQSWRRKPMADKVILKKAPYLVDIAKALFVMAKEKTGALIVIKGRESLHPHLEGGMEWDAQVRGELLLALFAKTSPVHDGAMIIKEGRICRVKAIIKFVEGLKVPLGVGTRHRSALGIIHKTDAVVLVVSEERGEVSVGYRRELIKVTSEKHFFGLLATALRGGKLK